MCGMRSLCCSYPTGVKKEISEPSLSFCSNPWYYPTTNYHSSAGYERKRERRGQRQFPHNMLSIKPSETDWDLGRWGGRLGEQGKISAVYPALPVCFFFLSLEHTPTQMEYIEAHTHTHTHTHTQRLLYIHHYHTPPAFMSHITHCHNQELGFLEPIIFILIY